MIKQKELIHLMSSDSSMRTKSNFKKLMVDPATAFEAIRLIPGGVEVRELVLTASLSPRFARLIIEDLPEYRLEDIFRNAIDGQSDWALKYFMTFDLKYPWIKRLLEKSEQPEVALSL